MSSGVQNRPQQATIDGTTYYHQFHAEGSALQGILRAPIEQKIETQIPLELNDRRGGHLLRTVSEVSIEGLVSIKHAETRVSGSKIKEKYVTLATTIVEGLNVFEVLSVDRVVSQVSTSHAIRDGHVPKVTFLGSRFENLQVCGVPVGITYDFAACPSNGASYLDSEFVKKAQGWTNGIASDSSLFGNAQELYQKRAARESNLSAETAKEPYKGLPYDDKLATLQGQFPGEDSPRITCSLVKKIDIAKVQERFPNVATVGHVLIIPDFGAVSLGEIEVGVEMVSQASYLRGTTNGSTPRPSLYFDLTMLNMELGCIGDATLKAARSKTNGTTNP